MNCDCGEVVLMPGCPAAALRAPAAVAAPCGCGSGGDSRGSAAAHDKLCLPAAASSSVGGLGVQERGQQDVGTGTDTNDRGAGVKTPTPRRAGAHGLVPISPMVVLGATATPASGASAAWGASSGREGVAPTALATPTVGPQQHTPARPEGQQHPPPATGAAAPGLPLAASAGSRGGEGSGAASGEGVEEGGRHALVRAPSGHAFAQPQAAPKPSAVPPAPPDAGATAALQSPAVASTSATAHTRVPSSPVDAGAGSGSDSGTSAGSSKGSDRGSKSTSAAKRVSAVLGTLLAASTTTTAPTGPHDLHLSRSLAQGSGRRSQAASVAVQINCDDDGDDVRDRVLPRFALVVPSHPHCNSLDADAPDWGLDDLEPLPPPVPPALRITPLTAGCTSGQVVGMEASEGGGGGLGSLARRRSSSSGSGLGLGLVPLAPTDSGLAAAAAAPSTSGVAGGAARDCTLAPADVAAQAAREHKRLLAAHARTETGRPEDDLPPPLTGFSAFQQEVLPLSASSPSQPQHQHLFPASCRAPLVPTTIGVGAGPYPPPPSGVLGLLSPPPALLPSAPLMSTPLASAPSAGHRWGPGGVAPGPLPLPVSVSVSGPGTPGNYSPLSRLPMSSGLFTGGGRERRSSSYGSTDGEVFSVTSSRRRTPSGGSAASLGVDGVYGGGVLPGGGPFPAGPSAGLGLGGGGGSGSGSGPSLLGRRVSLSGSSQLSLSSPLGSHSGSLPLPASLMSPVAASFAAPLSAGSAGGPGTSGSMPRSPFFGTPTASQGTGAHSSAGAVGSPLPTPAPVPAPPTPMQPGCRLGDQVAVCTWEEDVEDDDCGGVVILPANQDIAASNTARARLDSCGGSSSRRASEAFVRTVSSSSGGSSEGDVAVATTP